MAVIVCAFPALSVTTRITSLPSGRLVVPDSVGVVSLPSSSGVMVNDGAVVSMTPVSLADAVLPALSLIVAVTVTSPSASAVPGAIEKVSSDCTIALNVCTSPALSVTVTVTTDPAGSSVVPVISGVVSLVVSATSTVSNGETVSIIPASLSVALLPASSVAVTETVKLPSAIAAGTSTENKPPAATIAEKTWVFPALSTTVSCTVEPSGKFEVPVMVGVASFTLSISSSVTTGDSVSITPVSVSDAVLPAPSITVASTV